MYVFILLTIYTYPSYLSLSLQTVTYTLSRADVSDRDPLTLTADDRKVRPQNQVALLAVCEVLHQPYPTHQAFNTSLVNTNTSRNAAARVIATKRLESTLEASSASLLGRSVSSYDLEGVVEGVINSLD